MFGESSAPIVVDGEWTIGEGFTIAFVAAVLEALVVEGPVEDEGAASSEGVGCALRGFIKLSILSAWGDRSVAEDGVTGVIVAFVRLDDVADDGVVASDVGE